METKKKTKQIVVNVSEESKTLINSLKETYKVSDKEFIEAVLIVLNGTDADTIQDAIDEVVVEKQKAKLKAKIDKIQAKLDAAIAEAGGDTDTSSDEGEVVYSSADEEDEAAA